MFLTLFRLLADSKSGKQAFREARSFYYLVIRRNTYTLLVSGDALRRNMHVFRCVSYFRLPPVAKLSSLTDVLTILSWNE